jgi:D-glycero-D-manno-heptose 1,7-bisphosphate phosphatase
MKKALFLDRDGVINKEHDYVHKIEEFEFIEGVFEALQSAQAKGYLLIVITNQSGIGRGYYGEDDFFKLSEWMVEVLRDRGIHIDRIYHCPHAPDEGCDCRKPETGMIERAVKEFDIDLEKSWLVGDKESDIKAAVNAGIPHHILVRSGHDIDEGKTAAKHVCDTLDEAVRLLG